MGICVFRCACIFRCVLTVAQVKGAPFEHVMFVVLRSDGGARAAPVSAAEVAAESTVHSGAPRNQREVSTCSCVCATRW